MKKLKLLMLAPLPPPFSGPETLTHTLITGGLGEYFNLALIKSNVRQRNADKGRFDFAGVLRFICLSGKLIYEIIRTKPSIIYLPIAQNKVAFLRDALYILIAKLFCRKVIVHLMGSNFRNFYDSVSRNYQFLIKRILSLTDGLILQSDLFKSQFKDLFDIRKIAVLPSCIDTDKIKRVIVASPHSNKTSVVLFIGHLSCAKGFHDLINAVPIILSGCPNTEFWFLGEIINNERNILMNLAREKIINSERIQKKFASSLKYLGIIEYFQVLSKMKQADIFTLPSYSEGFSMAALEAMACGLPVVVTKVGAFPDFVKDGINGFLIEPGDFGQLAEKIIFLLRNRQLCANMAEINRISAEQNYSAWKIVPEMASILKKIALA